MSLTNPIIFRLPQKYNDSAEDLLAKSGEKNFNILSQKLLIKAIEESSIENNYSSPNSTDEHVQFLLAALGNTREIFLRVFKVLFAGADAKIQFENIIEELQGDWSAINQLYAQRADLESNSSTVFSDELSLEIDSFFETKFINSSQEKLITPSAGEAENISLKNLKQATLFD